MIVEVGAGASEKRRGTSEIVEKQKEKVCRGEKKRLGGENAGDAAD